MDGGVADCSKKICRRIAALELACGFAPVVVLLVALLSLRRRSPGENAWLLGLLAFALAVCMLPGAGIFRFSFRWLPLVHLVLALVAGAALEQWLASVRGTRIWGRHNLGFWALLLSVAVVLTMFSPGSRRQSTRRHCRWRSLFSLGSGGRAMALLADSSSPGSGSSQPPHSRRCS